MYNMQHYLIYNNLSNNPILANSELLSIDSSDTTGLDLLKSPNFIINFYTGRSTYYN